MGIISRVWGRFRGDKSAHKGPFILEGVNGNVCNKDFRSFGTTKHSCNSRTFWKTMPPISSHKKAYVRMAASLIKPRSVKTKGNKTLQAVIFKHSPLATTEAIKSSWETPRTWKLKLYCVDLPLAIWLNRKTCYWQQTQNISPFMIHLCGRR